MLTRSRCRGETKSASAAAVKTTKTRAKTKTTAKSNEKKKDKEKDNENNTVYVNVCAGDLPSIGILFYDMSIFFPTPRTREWCVYRNLSIAMSSKELREAGFPARDPEWAFLITSGKSQVMMAPNAGEIWLELNLGPTQVVQRLCLEEATQLSRELERNMKQPMIKLKSTEKHVRIHPVGKGVSYHADKSVYFGDCT